MVLTLAGLLFGWQLLLWPGLMMFIAAFVLFVVMSNRDSRLTEEEQRRSWEIAQNQGKLHYVVREFIGGLITLLPILTFELFFQYRSSSLGRWQSFLIMLGVMIVGLAVIPIVLWHLRERRFRQTSEPKSAA